MVSIQAYTSVFSGNYVSRYNPIPLAMIGEAQELVSSTILYYQMSIRIRLYLYQYFTINVNLDTTLSVSIPNPSSFDQQGKRTIQFNNTLLSMSIWTQLFLYRFLIYIYLSRKRFRTLLVGKPRNNYPHTVINAESNSN